MDMASTIEAPKGYHESQMRRVVEDYNRRTPAIAAVGEPYIMDIVLDKSPRGSIWATVTTIAKG